MKTMVFVPAVVLVASLAFAQSFGGAILGTITDPTGAVIPGVSLTITNAGTNVRAETFTDPRGSYVFPELAPGRYTVEATLPGFKRAVREGIVVQVQQRVTVDIALAIGEVTESVEVTASAPLTETTTSTVGKIVDNRRILNLPLNTRNVYSLIFLTPGVSGSVGNQYNSMSYSVNGARATMMDTLIDGVTASFPTVNGFTGISAFPSVDAIDEYKVMGANYSAEFGRSLGSVLNVVYKSGTNRFHGSAYEFLRNSIFDANNFFANRRGEKLGSFKRSQFGGTASGPIRHDRTFFMTSYEGLRERSVANTSFTVPTLLQRQGDFSQTFAANGQQIRIYNPFTTRANPSGSGFIRDPFPGNVIPSSLFDPVALNVLKYYSLPNQPGNAVTQANNYQKSASQQLNIDQFDVRIDENLSNTRKFFVRYSFRLTEDAPAIFFPTDLAVAQGRVIQENHVHNIVADYTQTISPKTILTTRLGFARTLFVFNNQGLGFKPSSLGLPKAIDEVVDRQMFPRFGASGYVSLGGSDHRYNAFMSYSALAGLTKVIGNHTVKFGFEGRMLRVNVWEARSAGTFNFSALFTQGPNPSQASSTAGNSIASLLLGTGNPNDVLIQGWKNVAAQSFYLAEYIQDDWRVTPRLTLNLGLRYDLDTPRTERFNRMNYFDPTSKSPLANKVTGYSDLKGGVVFVGVDGRSRHQYFWDRNNLAPRVGLAYQVTPKTVIRTGYAHVFGPSNQAAQGTVGPFGFRVEYPWVTTVDNITPLNLLRDPYPQGFRQPPGSSEGLLTQAGANLQAPLQDTWTPWTQQWNLNVQRELPGQIMLEVAYVGTQGHDLASVGESGRSLNQLDPKHLTLGSQLNQQVDNPFYGTVSNGLGLINQRRVSRAQLLRPYPQFTDIIPLYHGLANSSYHSMQVTLMKRPTHGLQFDVSYTWAKNLDEGMSHQNSYNLGADWSLTGIDLAHRFVSSYIYELPFGRNRRFGQSWSAWLDAIAGGWQFNGITLFQTGTPLSISASNTAGLFNPVTRANNNGKSGRKSGPVHERLDAYFDRSVFSQPTAFTFGNVTATLPDIRTDGVRNFDLSVFKEFRVREGMMVQFRTEMLNAFNTPRFGAPNTSVTSSTFGVVSSQANAPRQVQFGLKILW